MWLFIIISNHVNVYVIYNEIIIVMPIYSIAKGDFLLSCIQISLAKDIKKTTAFNVKVYINNVNSKLYATHFLNI